MCYEGSVAYEIKKYCAEYGLRDCASKRLTTAVQLLQLFKKSCEKKWNTCWLEQFIHIVNQVKQVKQQSRWRAFHNISITLFHAAYF